jgi:hypothetical protein
VIPWICSRAELKDLLGEHRSPRVSLFMPTHRGGAEADPIRFRRLLEDAEERLTAHGLRAAEAREVLTPARDLVQDPAFWRNQCDGLALFLAPEFLRIYRLPVALQETLEVGGLFHVTPLLPLLAGDGRFYVLALSQNGVRLLQGSRDAISALDLKGVPRNLAEALVAHDRDEPLTFHTRPAGGVGSWGAIFHGHGVGIDDEKDDLLRYFQRIDRGLHPLLRQESAPLIVAAVEYLQPLYRQANTYPYLFDRGIEGNPDRVSDKELHDRAWALVEPVFQETQRKAVALYHSLAGTGRASADVRQIVPAAYRGEVETAFVALGRELWGTLDPGRDRVELHERPEPGDEDLVNFVAVHTLLHRHTVFALRHEDTPVEGPVAGIYCLPLARHGKRP